MWTLYKDRRRFPNSPLLPLLTSNSLLTTLLLNHINNFLFSSSPRSYSIAMHYPFSSLAMAVMLGQLKKATAIPRGAPICEHSTSAYTIQSQTIGPGTPVTGSVTCPGEGGSKSSKAKPSNPTRSPNEKHAYYPAM